MRGGVVVGDLVGMRHGHYHSWWVNRRTCRLTDNVFAHGQKASLLEGQTILFLPLSLCLSLSIVSSPSLIPPSLSLSLSTPLLSGTGILGDTCLGCAGGRTDVLSHIQPS